MAVAAVQKEPPSQDFSAAGRAGGAGPGWGCAGFGFGVLGFGKIPGKNPTLKKKPKKGRLNCSHVEAEVV